MRKYNIGYIQLNSQEKKAYELFEKAFSSYAKSIDMSSISKNVDIMKVLQVALGDYPQYFYFNKTQIKVSSGIFGGKQLNFCGTYSMSQIKKMQVEINNAVETALSNIMLLNPLSEYEKTLCIYEYLQDNI